MQVRLGSGRIVVVIGDATRELGRFEELLVEAAGAEVVLAGSLRDGPAPRVLIDECAELEAMVVKLSRRPPAPEPIFTGIDRRRSKGERKRGRADRWR